MLAQLQQNYPDQVRIIYRHFPLISIHDKAALSAQAAEAAGIQGKFWEMHDLLFERQAEWAQMPVEEFQDWVIQRAGELDLDTDKFTADLTSEELASAAQSAWDAGVAAELRGTPALFFNGQDFNVPLSYGNIATVVELMLLESRQFSTCPEMALDPAKQYFATLKTEKGDVVIELFNEQSPLAVNSFVFLANNDWFDDVTFHRVLPGFVAQAGDPTGTGYGGPGYAFDIEVSGDLKFDGPGVVAMANAGPGSNGSQFFITYAETPNLDGGYTIFGQVVSGMEVVESLTPRDPAQSPNLPPGDKILDVVIEVK